MAGPNQEELTPFVQPVLIESRSTELQINSRKFYENFQRAIERVYADPTFDALNVPASYDAPQSLGHQLEYYFRLFCCDAIKAARPDEKPIGTSFPLGEAARIFGIQNTHDGVKQLGKLIKERAIDYDQLSVPAVKESGAEFQAQTVPRGRLKRMVGEQMNVIPADVLLVHGSASRSLADIHGDDLRRGAMVHGDLTMINDDGSLSIGVLWNRFIEKQPLPEGTARHTWSELAVSQKLVSVQELIHPLAQ